MEIKRIWHNHMMAHLGWIIFDLIVFIIILISFKIGTIESVKDIINTALALGSITLALVAIFQALLSGDASNRILGELKHGVENLKVPSSDILEAAKILADHSAKISESATAIDRRLSLLDSSATVSEKSITNHHSLPINTVGGNLALLICIKSLKYSLSFNPIQIFDKSDPSGLYTQGYISALLYTKSVEISRRNRFMKVEDLKDLSWLLEQESDLEESLTRKRSEAVERIKQYFERSEDEAEKE